jgi:hypothetical protein
MKALTVQPACQFNYNGISVALNNVAIKQAAIPNSEETCIGSNAGREGKIIHVSWTKFLEIVMIKVLSLGLL